MRVPSAREENYCNMNKDYIQTIGSVKKEIKKAVVGKDDVIDKTLMAILSGGHILLDDIPGVGKTTLALALSKALGLSFNRVQFTPDVVPSDITGFSMYDKEKGSFEYREGAAMCNFLLADEINRTSSKTQSALLEVMQEGSITVDGVTRMVPKPFIVVATQNPIGTAGTQMLPEAQVDRFMIQLSMGYPTAEEQVMILEDRDDNNEPLETVQKVMDCEQLMDVINETAAVNVDKKIKKYIADIAETSRNHQFVKLGLSPRGAIAIMRMAKACAYVRVMDYVIPEHVNEVFPHVARHRLILNSKAQMNEVTKEDVIKDILAISPEAEVYEKGNKR